MHSSQVPVEPRLTVERLLTSSDGTLVPLRLAVDRLDVHEEVVSDAEATPTFLALCVCVCECVCVCMWVRACVCT